MSHQISLDGVHSLTGLLERVPLGVQAQELAQRLSIWTTQAHQNLGATRTVFPRNVSELDDGSLSDAFAYWTSELFRIHELVGLLNGLKMNLDLRLKKEKAAARGRARREHEEKQVEGVRPTKITAGEVNDLAEEDEKVQDVETDLVTLLVVREQALSHREAVTTARDGLSREISFRQAQLQARVR